MRWRPEAHKLFTYYIESKHIWMKNKFKSWWVGNEHNGPLKIMKKKKIVIQHVIPFDTNFGDAINFVASTSRFVGLIINFTVFVCWMITFRMHPSHHRLVKQINEWLIYGKCENRKRKMSDTRIPAKRIKRLIIIMSAFSVERLWLTNYNIRSQSNWT